MSTRVTKRQLMLASRPAKARKNTWMWVGLLVTFTVIILGITAVAMIDRRHAEQARCQQINWMVHHYQPGLTGEDDLWWSANCSGSHLR